MQYNTKYHAAKLQTKCGEYKKNRSIDIHRYENMHEEFSFYLYFINAEPKQCSIQNQKQNKKTSTPYKYEYVKCI